MFEELLDDIVAEDILHQLNSIRLNLAEDPIFLLAVRDCEFVLDETRPVLISTELDNVAINFLGSIISHYTTGFGVYTTYLQLIAPVCLG